MHCLLYSYWYVTVGYVANLPPVCFAFQVVLLVILGGEMGLLNGSGAVCQDSGLVMVLDSMVNLRPVFFAFQFVSVVILVDVVG